MYSSYKIRKRYIFAEFSNFKKDKFFSNLLDFFGEKDYGKIGLKILEINENSLILSCNRKFLEPLLGALAIMEEPRIKVKHISGTIKGLKEKIEGKR